MKHIEVVAAIIKHGGKFLATQRGYGDWRGFWEFPGGKIELGEAREEALIREIREELRMGIAVERLLCTTEYDYPAFHLTMHCYLCHITEANSQFSILNFQFSICLPEDVAVCTQRDFSLSSRTIRMSNQ